jgi:hypothetical protein
LKANESYEMPSRLSIGQQVMGSVGSIPEPSTPNCREPLLAAAEGDRCEALYVLGLTSGALGRTDRVVLERLGSGG